MNFSPMVPEVAGRLKELQINRAKDSNDTYLFTASRYFGPPIPYGIIMNASDIVSAWNDRIVESNYRRNTSNSSLPLCKSTSDTFLPMPHLNRATGPI